MRRPLTPMEFADTVIDLPLDQVQELIRADLDAELNRIRANRTEPSGDNVVSLPAPTEHPDEEAA